MAGMTEIGIKLRLDGASQVQAGATQAAQAVQSLSSGTKAFGQGAQLTGQQTAQMSAQLQDFFVQVQAGGSPMTAFLQQGSQMSAIFGGAGNALRAVTSLVTPAVAGMAVLGAGVGAVAYAFANGDRERMAFLRGIVTTGNAAGVTASQLGELSKAASSFGATRGQGADVLAQLVSTGKVAASVLGSATEAAIRLEREAGVAIKDTVAAFADIGKDPVDGLKKLNEAQNFLTASTYREIAALQDRGKTAEAARVAQEAYAAASTSSMKTLESQLGAVETAWRAMGKGAKAAWDAILNVGRPATLQDQLNQALAAAAVFDAPGRKSQDPIRDEQRKASAKQRVDDLRAQIYAEQELAQAMADQAEQAAKAIKKIDEQRDAHKKAQEEAAKLAKAGAELAQSLLLESAQLNDDFLQKWNKLNAARAAGKFGVEQLIKVQGLLLQQQPFIKAALEQELKTAQAVATARAAARAAEDKSITDYLQAQEDARQAALKSVQGRVAALATELQATELMHGTSLSLAEAIELVAIARLQEARAKLLDGSDAAAAIQKEIDARRELLGLMATKRTQDDAARAADAAAKDWQRTTDSIRDGLTDAFRRAFESGENFGTAFAKTIGNEIKARVSTAIAGALADGVMSLLGLTVANAAAANGGGGNSTFGTASNLASLYSMGSRAYSGAQSLYGWAAGTSAAPWAATAGTGMVAQTGTYGTMLGSSTGLGAGTGMGGTGAGLSYNAGSTWSGVVANEAATTSATTTASTSGASSAGISAVYAAIAIKSYQQAQKDYAEGFRTAQSRDAIDRYGPGISPAGGAETYVADLFRRMGMSDRWSEVLSGSSQMARIFGRSAPQIQSTGVAGTLANGGFEGQAFTDVREKGGWLRSDKNWTEFEKVPDELGRFLSAASKSVFDQAKTFGEALGLPAQALAGVSTDIKVKLTDDVEANKEELIKALGGYGEKLVESWAAAVKPLAAYGETTVQTIERVGGAITGVNEVLDALGVNALAASVEGGKAALNLLGMFGSLGDLQQAAGSYLQDYYSASERAALTTKALGERLAEVGLQLPATRDAFRDLVEAQDLSTESGQQAFGALMSVAASFAEITPSAEGAAQAMKQLAADLQDAKASAIERLATPAQAIAYRSASVAQGLAGLGVPLSTIQQMLQAPKEALLGLAQTFEMTSSASLQAKAAVYDAAVTLGDLRDASTDLADEVQKAADKLFEQKKQLLSGVDGVATDFLAGSDLANYRAERIRQTLAEGGIDASTQSILTSTLADVRALWDAVGIDGRQAVLNAYGAWKQLNAELNAPRITDLERALAGITEKFGDLTVAIDKVPPLSEVYARNVAELKQLEDGLAQILGTASKSAQQVLADLLTQKRAITEYRASLRDAIADARLRGMTPADRVAALRQQEASLFSQLGTAADPVAVAQKLQGVVTRRIEEEAALRAKSNDAQIEALQKQIEGAERLQQLSEQIAQFTGSMRFGDLSPLGYEQQLGAARSLYETTLGKAQGGDVNAMGQLTGNAQAYLQEARSYYASSESYAGIFDQVLGQLDALGAVDPQLKAMQDQLTALQTLNDTQQAVSDDVLWASAQQVTALTAIDDAMAKREAAAKLQVDRQIQLAEDQITELRTMVADQKAQLVQQAAIAKALTDELKRLNGTTAAAATEASLAGAAP